MILSKFIREFIGYGSLEANTWFIGPEEGGGKSVEELEKRLKAWHRFGTSSVVDLKQFHEILGVTNFWGSKPRLQPTWAKLSLMQLAARGEDCSQEAVREYQANRLGRADGNTLLAELLPLPKQSVTSWPYAELDAQIPYLKDLRSYQEAVLPSRVRLLSDTISEYQPIQVVFYGTGHKNVWEKVAGVQLRETVADCFEGKNRQTRFLLVKHPNARGVSNEYFSSIARRCLLPADE